MNNDRILHILPPIPSRLPKNIAQSPNGNILLGMRNSHFSLFFRMFELMVITFCMVNLPRIGPGTKPGVNLQNPHGLRQRPGCFPAGKVRRRD